MKKLFLVIAVSLMSAGLQAEEASKAGNHSTAGAPPASTSAATSVPVSRDKSGKLFQYINACLVSRPSSSDETIRKLFQ